MKIFFFLIFITVVKIYQKGFSQEESDSSNLLLSLMKRTEDVTILKFISLEKLLLQIIRLAQSHSHSFLESPSEGHQKGHFVD